MRRIALFVVLFLGSSQVLLNAQDFKVFERTVQFHGFASQGFIYTSDNNWLTMGTASGSGAMTDMDVGRVMAKLVGRQVVAGQLHGVKARLAVCPAGDHNRQRWILMSVL